MTTVNEEIEVEKIAGSTRLANALVAIGWRLDEPVLDREGDGGLPVNPAALLVCGYRYRTLTNPRGVRFAVEGVQLYMHKHHVYRGDPSVVTPDAVTIAGLVTPEADRRRGHGSAALAVLCRVATELGITLSLEPVQLDGHGKKNRMTTPRLQKWYARNGFRPIKTERFNEDYSIMRRPPTA